MRRPRHRLTILVATFLACATTVAACLPASAGATVTTPTVTGTWSCCGSGGAGAQTWTITESNGTLSGSGPGVGPINGSISGTSVTIVTGPYPNSSYEATFKGTIAANGESMSGTWIGDKGGPGQEGTWTATRTSGSPTVTIETTQEKEAKEAKAKQEAKEKQEKEAKEKEEAEKKKPKGTQPTTMIVNCNQEMPDKPTAYFECTVEVINASLTQPLAIPSGTVSFAVNPGGSGGFRGSNVCNLKASEIPGSNSSFCSVIYVAVPPGSIAIGSQPPITGTYSGDNVFKSNTAIPRSPLPNVPQANAQASGPNISLTMTCPAGVICTGTTQMTANPTQTSAKGSATAATTVVVASGRYSIKAGKKGKVKLRLTKKGRALLKKSHRNLVVTLAIKPKHGTPVSKAMVLK